eukprot:8368744-Pyramimonas_sp.AAC.1
MEEDVEHASYQVSSGRDLSSNGCRPPRQRPGGPLGSIQLITTKWKLTGKRLQCQTRIPR